ncbi:MAG: hypothetical protein ACRC56_11905 [Bosea sp. (in: a-proteobacteria)]
MAISNGLTNPIIGYGEAGTLKVIGGPVAVPVGGLALNAVTPVLRVPAGFTVFDLTVMCSDMDTGGTPTLVFGVGDAGNATRLATGITVGQAGGANQAALSATAIGYRFPAETTIHLIATTAAATAAAGTATVYLRGTID